MSCHALNVLALEHTAGGNSLIHVALMRTGGMGVDVIDVIGCHAGAIEGACHGEHAAVIAWLTDAAAVA